MHTMTEHDPKFRTVTLTNRNPVAIVEAEWPEIAGDSYEDRTVGGVPGGSYSRKEKGWLKVREHADGRQLVYGGVSLATSMPGESGYLYRGGELLEPNASAATVVARLVDDLVNQSGQARLRLAGRVVLAKLPAEVL